MADRVVIFNLTSFSFRFEMKNNGKITMEYSWQIIMEDPVSQSSIVADRRPSTATHSARWVEVLLKW